MFCVHQSNVYFPFSILFECFVAVLCVFFLLRFLFCLLRLYVRFEYRRRQTSKPYINETFIYKSKSVKQRKTNLIAYKPLQRCTISAFGSHDKVHKNNKTIREEKTFYWQTKRKVKNRESNKTKLNIFLYTYTYIINDCIKNVRQARKPFNKIYTESVK